jgi:glycosyltransferase involved in cell wall biosynthesis
MDRPLRIAIFGESYLPYLSGVTIATQSLAHGLAAAGHRVLLVVPAPSASAPSPVAGDRDAGVEIAWLPSYQGPPPAPAGYRMPLPVASGALRHARELRPDVVHAQSPFVSGLMARRTARATGAPLVFTHHTRFGDYGHYLGPLAAPGGALMHAYLRRFWAGCAAIVSPSTDLAAEIENDLGGGRRPLVRAIPTGLDLAVLRGLAPLDPRAIAGWPPDSSVVVSVGRLAREKSAELLIQSFATAAAEDPRLRLLLVGGGPLEGQLAARASAPPLAGRVHLAGRLPRLDGLALAAGADLFAFASATETQGLVLAEALAMGLPVVALDGPGVQDSVRDGADGIIVPRARDDAESGQRLAEAIVALAGDARLRSAMSVAARDGADRFDLQTRIAQVVGLYREVVAQG